MAEEPTPPAPQEQSLSKKSTVRITLPPKPGAAAGNDKKETIRINLPPPGVTVKKETVRIGEMKKETIRINLPAKTGVQRDTIRINLAENKTADEASRTTMPIDLSKAGGAPAPTPPPPAGKIPLPPKLPGTLPPAPSSIPVPPPRPPGPAMPPPPASIPSAPKPPQGLVPPTPPAAPLKPVLPVIPAAPAAPAAPVLPATPVAPVANTPNAPAAPAAQKPVAPKKETTRIALPPDPKSMPKTTVKLNQTAPLSTPMPAPSIKTIGVATTDSPSQEDPMMLPLSIAALVAAIFVLVTAFIAG